MVPLRLYGPFGCFAHWLVSWRIRACIGRAHALNKEACEFVSAPLRSSSAPYSCANFRQELLFGPMSRAIVQLSFLNVPFCR